MTALIQVHIACNGCGQTGRETRSSAWRTRVVLSTTGWHRNNAADVCPDCWDAGVRGQTYPRSA